MFTILGPILQIINFDRLVLITKKIEVTIADSPQIYQIHYIMNLYYRQYTKLINSKTIHFDFDTSKLLEKKLQFKRAV